jgi:hypothetical protein
MRSATRCDSTPCNSRGGASTSFARVTEIARGDSHMKRPRWPLARDNPPNCMVHLRVASPRRPPRNGSGYCEQCKAWYFDETEAYPPLCYVFGPRTTRFEAEGGGGYFGSQGALRAARVSGANAGAPPPGGEVGVILSMAKTNNARKQTKKAPQKTAQQKRAAKRQKKTRA